MEGRPGWLRELAGAVPLDLLKEEQDRITKELANAGAVLANADIQWQELQDNLTAALGLATRFGEAYMRCGPRERRWFNQAVLESVHVDVDGRLAKVTLAQPFKTFLERGLVSALEQELKNREPGRVPGSNIDGLVEVMPPDTNRGPKVAGGWIRLGGRKPAGASCRDEVAAALFALAARDGRSGFTVREVHAQMVAAGTRYTESTVLKTMQRMKSPSGRPPYIQLQRAGLQGFRLAD